LAVVLEQQLVRAPECRSWRLLPEPVQERARVVQERRPLSDSHSLVLRWSLPASKAPGLPVQAPLLERAPALVRLMPPFLLAVLLHPWPVPPQVSGNMPP
jgi:hypothetical protein